MDCYNVFAVSFSPSGNTMKITEAAAREMSCFATSIDLLKDSTGGEQHLSPVDLAVVGMPVFSGRIPAPAAEQLKKLHGKGTPAVAIVVYGNRDYDDALLELKDTMEGQGFCVIAAAAFIARHSIFPKLAAGRPDDADFKLIRSFASECVNKLKGIERPLSVEDVKGSRPYKKSSPIPFKPYTYDNCNNCGLCAKICPVKAIDAENPRLTNNALCITCTACIYICPKAARSLAGVLYSCADKAFRLTYAKRKEPEMFI